MNCHGCHWLKIIKVGFDKSDKFFYECAATQIQPSSKPETMKL